MMNNWKKNTVLFLASQTVSLFGSSLVQYAITWFITLQTKSGVMTTISIVCAFVPMLFISPLAGVWADRYNKKMLIILSDGMIALSTLVLAILFMTGHGSIWLLFAASAIRSLGSGIQGPAVSAFLPRIVPEEHLTRVNGLSGSMQSLVNLLSPMLSGVLLSMAAIEMIFFIDVITAAIAIAILLLFLYMPKEEKRAEKQKTSYFKDMREGLTYIREHAFLKTVFAFSGFYFIFISPLMFLTPLQIARSFGDEVWRLTASEIFFSVGMVAGGLAIASWGGFKNRVYTIILASIVISVCTFGLGLIPVFLIYLVLMGVIGIAIPMFSTPFTVILQEKTDREFMGRVFGILSMISGSVLPLAMLFYGPVADYVKIEWLLIITGCCMLVQSVFLMKNKVLIKAGERKKDTGDTESAE